MNAFQSGAMRARISKEQAELRRWLEAGLRAWLTAPVAEGGLGYDAARTEAAVRKWHPEPKQEEETRG